MWKERVKEYKEIPCPWRIYILVKDIRSHETLNNKIFKFIRRDVLMQNIIDEFYNFYKF